MTDVRGVRIVYTEPIEEEPYCFEYIVVDDGIRMSSLQFLQAEGGLIERILTKVSSPNLKWLRWMHCHSSFLPSSVPMKNLRVLQIEGCDLKTLWEEELEPPLQLRELEIKAPLSDIPKSIRQLNHLERIVICYVYGEQITITELPEEFCFLRSLKVLLLEGWSRMEALPKKFGNLTQLQHLQLSTCSALKSLPDSFCKLIKLQHLDLHSCFELSFQRETLGDISTLKYIDLSECGKIEELPSQVAHQRSLEQLLLSGTSLKELPSAIGELSCMKVLRLGDCPLLDKLPFQLYDLKKLKELSIYGWQELKVLPDALCDLKNLKELSIRGCKKLKCLPTSIGLLTQLTVLRVSQCPLIRELPLKEEIVRGKSGTLNDFQILPRLQELEVSETGISEVSFAERVCCNLRRLSIESCNNLVEVGKLPNTLLHLSFTSCHNLRRIDQIHGPAKLQYLNITYCIKLEELPRRETLIFLSKLDARGCVKLKRIPVLGQLTKLEYLGVESCSELQELDGIQHCICLRTLRANRCVKLKNIRGLEQLENLEKLYIYGCSDLEEVEGIQHCTSLYQFAISKCPKLQLYAGVEERLYQRCRQVHFD